MGIHLIVGLGNPGPQYTKTRHNAGAWFVEQLCEQRQTALQYEAKFKGLLTKILINNHTCQVLTPTTFMNQSGESVSHLAQFYKIAFDEILVVHDDLDLPPGSARLKLDGGHGGHNGLRDIISRLGTNRFYRLRLGIGHPGHKDDVHDYVLHRPSLDDNTKIRNAIDHALSVLPDIISGQIEKAMNYLHTITK